MARIATASFELALVDETGSNEEACNGRLPGSVAYSLSREPGTSTLAAGSPVIFLAAQKHTYYRVYVRVRKYPGTNHLRLIGSDSTPEGLAQAWYVVLDDTGHLRAYSKGNGAKTQVGSTSTQVLALDRWYRLSGHIEMRGPVGADGANLIEVKIDGAGAISGSISDPNNGINGAGNVATGFVCGTNGETGAETDGGQVEFDDMVCDNAVEPGPGGITLLHVTGQGTHDGWLLTGFGWRAVVRRQINQFYAVDDDVSVRTNVLNAKTSYTVETMASKGLAGVTIKSWHIVANGTTQAGTNRYLIRKNGVETLSGTWGTNTQVFLGSLLGTQGSARRGWMQDVATFPMAPSDTIEIGLQMGSTGISRLQGIWLLVEWEGSDPAPVTETGDIKIVQGSYVGNGTGQDVSFADATFKPTMIIVLAEGTSPYSRFIWTRGMGTQGDGAQQLTTHYPARGFSNVVAGGFSVAGDTDGINTNGVTHRYLAIRDHSQRFINTGFRSFNSISGASDNNDVRLDDAVMNPTVLTPASDFEVDAVFAFGRRGISSETTSNNHYRDVNYVGDKASSVGTSVAAIADAIQSQGVGTFQLGTVNVDNGGLYNNTPWIAITRRAAVFTIRVLVEIGTYVGNGAASRVIPLTLLGNPAFIYLVPETNTARHYRFFADGAGTTSREINGGTARTTAITAFDTVGQVTVGALCNVNLTVYHYIAFAEGDDPAVLPEQTFADGTVQHPLTWIELTDRAETLHVFAEVDLNDNLDYFGGYKAPWVIKFLSITRGLSDRLGQPEHMSFGAMLSDTTRFFRELLDNVATKYLVNRPLTERMIDDEARRLEGTPRLAAVGYVNAYSPRADLQFEINGSDWLKRKFSRKARAASAWQPIITLADFPNRPDNAKDFAVPIIYGQISDTDLEDVTIVSSVVLELDPAISNGGPNYHMQSIPGSVAYQFDNPAGRPVWVQLIPMRNGKGGPQMYAYGQQIISTAGWIFGNGEPPDTLGTSGVCPLWEMMEGNPDSYRVYWADAGDFNPYVGFGSATKARFIDHPADNFNGRREHDYEQEITDYVMGTDALVGTTTIITIDHGKGAYVPIYVGIYDVGGIPYHKWVIARHACKSIDEIYVDDSELNLQTDPAVAGTEGNWLVPGYPKWIATFGAQKYEVIGGKRYSVIYGRVNFVVADRAAGVVPLLNDGAKAFGLSVQGIETIGDGTGILITQIALQAKHFAVNFMAPEIPTPGAWLAQSPFFEHIPDLPLIDELSFDNVDVESGNRLPGGYRGDGVIGPNGEKVSALDALALFNVSGDFDSFFNRKGQYSISMEPILQSAGLPTLNDVINITEGSFEIEDDVNSEFFNILPYRDTRDFAGRVPDGWHHIDEFRSDVSIDLYDQERASPNFDLHLLRNYTEQGAATVIDVMARKSGRYRDPRRTVTLKLPFSGLNYEPGNVAPITHLEGIGATGWLDHDVRITRHEVEPSAGIVRLDAYDLESLFGLNGLWAPEDVLDYESATAEQRRLYLFWSEDGQNFYPDGAPVKNWS